ncbi:MAG: twin-arginine translocation signal domain-containing protein, partial [Desulfovermiculus sp.]
MTTYWQEQIDAAREDYKNGNCSRRDFLKVVTIAGAAVGLVGGPFTWARRAMAADSIRFDSWGGTTSDAFRKHAFEPFEKKTGIEVREGEFGDMDTYLTRVKASYPPGGEFNLAHLSAVFDYARYVGLGFDSVIDESK